VIVHVVTDQPLEDDGEGTDLVRRLALAFPGVVVEICAVAGGDTLAAGFCVAQLACADGSDRRLVACWVGEDPAGAAPGPWPEGAGPRLCVGRGVAGTLIVGPNAGFGWSLAMADLRGLCFLDVALTGRGTWGGTVATAVAHAHCRHRCAAARRSRSRAPDHAAAPTGRAPSGDVASRSSGLAHVTISSPSRTSSRTVAASRMSPASSARAIRVSTSRWM
jgi:hypothetical protein